MDNEIDTINYDETKKINELNVTFKANDLTFGLSYNKTMDGEDQHINITTEFKSKSTNIIVYLLINEEHELTNLEEFIIENNIEDLVKQFGEEIIASKENTNNE